LFSCKSFNFLSKIFPVENLVYKVISTYPLVIWSHGNTVSDEKRNTIVSNIIGYFLSDAESGKLQKSKNSLAFVALKNTLKRRPSPTGIST
jgi:hypothetical protein